MTVTQAVSKLMSQARLDFTRYMVVMDGVTVIVDAFTKGSGVQLAPLSVEALQYTASNCPVNWSVVLSPLQIVSAVGLTIGAGPPPTWR